MNFDTGGLALEQAPPVDLPARFFLTAPLFAAAAGLLVIWDGEVLLASRWAPGALAAVHLLAVGFLGQVMCGALLQMLPVLAGSPVPRVRLIGTWVHLLLSVGGALLSWGLWTGAKVVLAVGAIAAAAGFLLFLSSVVAALVRAKGAPDTVRAIRLAVTALAVTVLLGPLLAAALIWPFALPDFVRWVDAHAIAGLLGWVGVLILGVAFQVIPMFYVTPGYPVWLRRLLAPLIILAIGAGVLLRAVGAEDAGFLLISVAAAGFATFAVATMRLLIKPARRRLDVTRLHWWAAMILLCVAAAVWVLDLPTPLVGVMLLVGIGVGVSTGMLLKILPFLYWFHLQQAQLATGRLDVRVPYMQGFIPERPARTQFALHLGSLLLLAATVVWPPLASTGGAALVIWALFLEVLLISAAGRYRRTARALQRPATMPP